MSSEFQPVARLSDIDDGTMREVTRDGNKILLVRGGETVTAIAATCPHAGGPLAEGVLSGDRIICPWHKAAFRVTDGSCLEPPAVDNLACDAVEIRDGEILVAATATDTPAFVRDNEDRRRFVVVRGDLGESGFLAYYLRERQVAAAIGLGRERDIAAIIELMTRRRDWTIEELHPNDSSPAAVLAQS
jgi:nitrite reductase/ring-hydroxylating ferredoxin subunit